MSSPFASKLKPWKTLASRGLLERLPWVSLWEEDVRLPNGLTIEGYLRCATREYAMTFALLMDGTVPLVLQYKHGVGALSYDLPAGYLDDPEEEPLAAAQRELREETGIEAEHWETLGRLLIDTNRGGSSAHLFLATGAHAAAQPHLDATEDLEVRLHTPRKLGDMVLSGEITSMASAAAIMMGLERLRRSGLCHG
jgi:8-oxo-dGTP pyrophosphatase MutT (NUDIX family)